MKTLFVVLFLFSFSRVFADTTPALWPTCHFEQYQGRNIEAERLSYQEIVGEQLIVHLDLKRKYEGQLIKQISQCYSKMAAEHFKSCSFGQLKHHKERSNPEEVVYERHYLGANYRDTNWLIDSRTYEGQIKPIKKFYYTEMRSWLDHCYTRKNLKRATHAELSELYQIIRDSQLNRMSEVIFFTLTPENSLPTTNFVKGEFWGGKDGTFQRIQIQYKELKVVSEKRTGDDEYERVEVTP